MAGLQDPRQSLVQWRLWQVRPQQLCLYFDVKQKHVLVTWTWAHFSWVIFVVARSSIKSMFCACCWFWKDHHLYYLQLNLTNKNHPKYCTSADVYSAAGFEPSVPLSHQCMTFKHTFQMTTLVFLSLAVGQEKKKNSMSSPPNLFLHQNKKLSRIGQTSFFVQKFVWYWYWISARCHL